MAAADLPQVTIYSDGACDPNPGSGGWAAILLFPDRQPQELVGGEPQTTNNRMELKAALEALRSLPAPHRVHLYTDSEYLRRGITEWLPLWEKRNWRTTENTDVKNQEFWEPLAIQLERHQIIWHWVKGHTGNRWNERADHLARSAIPRPELPLDDEVAIHMFTGVSYLGKHKKGGWGVLLRYGDRQKTLSGSVADTSSNRMHLQAAIEGLRAIIKPLPIHLYTSSDYLKDGATAWVNKWIARDWKTKDGKSVSHRDLWEQLTELTKDHQITWHVVPRRDSPPEMVQAKELATTAAHSD